MSRASRDRYWKRRVRAELWAQEQGYEPFDKFDVAEWSGWICGICYKPIDSPDELTIDHIRPLAAGGRHVPSNVVAAHRSCNCFRGGIEGHEYHTAHYWDKQRPKYRKGRKGKRRKAA